jgi:predicted DNA-binding transcriptional regulator AlpA
VTDATRDNTLKIAPLWSVEDVAAYLRVPVQTAYSWRAKGTGPRARKVGKYLRYRPEDVIAWFDGPDAGAA